MTDEERQLWSVGAVECVMISCCSGAELQLRRVRRAPTEGAETAGAGEIVLRELYPTKSDLYERARELRIVHEGAGSEPT